MPRDPIGLALGTMNRLAGNRLLDQLHLRKPIERLAYQGTKGGFQALTLTGRQFRRVRDLISTRRLPTQGPADLFDLTLDDDQQMIMDSLGRIARDLIRPHAALADEHSQVPKAVQEAVAEMGLPLHAVPEVFGGVAERQSPVTSVLIAEALAWGDMGIASALLAPYSVAQTIARWGNGEQQSRYLPAFCEETPPIATIAVDEPRPLFDPAQLHT